MKKLLLIIIMLLFLVTPSYGEPLFDQLYFSTRVTKLEPGTYTLRFSIWDDPKKGTMVWSEEQVKTLVDNIIDDNLGDINPLPDIDYNLPWYVQVDIIDGTKMKAVNKIRERLGVSQYALWSLESLGVSAGFDADTVDGQHASEFASSSHSHSGANITSGTIDSARLNVGTTAGTVAEGSHSHASTFVDLSTDQTVGGTKTFSNNITAPQLVSSIPVGTQPLQVTSTTMVNNLNAEMVGGKNSNELYTKAEVDAIIANLQSQIGNLQYFWHLPELINVNDSNVEAININMDGNGNAIAIWNQNSNININMYVYEGGWSGAQSIEAGSYPLNISLNNNGNSMASWYQNGFVAKQYTVGNGWETGQTFSGSFIEPQIAINKNGDIIAIGLLYEDSVYNLYANHYTVDGGWGTPQLLETGSGTIEISSYGTPQIAINDNGDGFAVWTQFDGSTNSIYTNRYVAGSVWEGAQLLEDSGYQAREPYIAIDNNGNAIAIWSQGDSFTQSIFTNRYLVGSGWQGTQLIETNNNYDADRPRIVMNDNGYAMAIWRQSDGSFYNVFTNRYVPNIGWEIPQILKIKQRDATDVRVAINNNGNAVAAWKQYERMYGASEVYGIYANYYVADSGWRITQALTTTELGVSPPEIAIDDNGNAITIWVSDWNNFYACRFSK